MRDSPSAPRPPTAGRQRLHDVSARRRGIVTVDNWRLRTMSGGTGRRDRDRSLSEASLVTDLSADGATLALAVLGSSDSPRGAYLVPLDGGPPLRLGPGFPLAISPSGERVAANVVDGSSRQLVAYSTRSGERAVIATPGPVSSARWLDERTLVASAGHRIWRLAIGAPPAPLGAPGISGTLAIDPARRRCAFVDARDQLHVLAVADGAPLRPPTAIGRRIACGWHADSDAILATHLERQRDACHQRNHVA